MSSTEEIPPESAGFFSSASRLSLPVGPRIDPGGVAGYPIDLRAKATSAHRRADRDPELARLYVDVCQFGLGCYERFLAGEGEPWLQAAIDTGHYVIDRQQADGSFIHPEPFAHTFPLPPGWRCGMAQGQAASLFVRLFRETGEERWAEGAHAALRPLDLPVGAGGVAADRPEGRWPEEYPTSPPSLVLNGAIFAWWGVRDVAVGLQDSDAQAAFRAGVQTLKAMLPRFDLGWWTLYCLFPFPVSNVASSFYQALHVAQLRAMHLLAPDPVLPATADRWESYLESSNSTRRALVHKVAFRLLVPRNQLLAYRLPWSRRPPAASAVGA